MALPPVPKSNKYEFQLVGTEDQPFGGYISSQDRTNLSPRYMVRGSKNMILERSGTIANRCGLLRRGAIDATATGIKSSFVYRTNSGVTIPLRVTDETAPDVGDAKLQVESSVTGSPLWYNLTESGTLVNPALTKMRFSFDTWFDGDLSNGASEFKDLLVMVRGGVKEILHWSGGISRMGAVVTFTDAIDTLSIEAGSLGYEVGDVLTLVVGGTQATVFITDVSNTGVIQSDGFYIQHRGGGYTVGTGKATTGGSGTGAVFTVLTLTTAYTLAKYDTSTTWKEDGFTNQAYIGAISASSKCYTKFIVGGTEFEYRGGADTTTLVGLIADPSLITPLSANDVVIQSVYVEEADELSEGFACDFIRTLENQLCVGSYSSRIVHISCSTTVNDEIGFLNFLAISNDLVIGDPDFVILDDTVNGMIPRNGKLYISSGQSDWWEIEINFQPPIDMPLYHGLSGSNTAYVITKVSKKPGTGLSGLMAHEFADIRGNNIIYLGKDNQVHTIGIFTQIEGTQFPTLSQAVFDEFENEDFTGGHLRCIGDFTYITAPLNSRHWLLEQRSDVNRNGNIETERIWHTPQVASISRFEEIEGVVFGHSSANPQIYQVWDTGQWHDDEPAAESAGLPYICVMKMAFRNYGKRDKYHKADQAFYEGYMLEGTKLYGNIHYEYQGAKGAAQVIINGAGADKIARFFSGATYPYLGESTVGFNPLGESLVDDPTDQELVPKFVAVRGFTEKNWRESQMEVYSVDVDCRWEILCLGLNARLSGDSIIPLTKSS